MIKPPFDKPIEEQTLYERLINRAAIRRGLGRGSGERDRISDLLEEAAENIQSLEDRVEKMSKWIETAIFSGMSEEMIQSGMRLIVGLDKKKE